MTKSLRKVKNEKCTLKDLEYGDIIDKGVGIEDIGQAMQPLFTTGADKERSGMGFAFMEAFMDRLEVESSPNEGTCVHMWKSFITGQISSQPILQAAVWNRSGRE